MDLTDETREALLKFLSVKGSDVRVALLLTSGELGVLHMALEIVQGLLSTVDPATIPPGEFEALQAKVGLLLATGGYEAPAK